MTTYEIAMVEAAKEGDGEAFEALFGIYSKKVYALALATVRNETDAEDIMQQAFINAWRYFDRLKDAAAFNTWIQRITLNFCNSHLRKKNITILQDAESETDIVADIESDELLPSVYAERDDLRERLGKIIDSLSHVQKQTVLLYYFDELKVEEIARVMECSVGTVKTRLHLACKSIRAEVEENERRSGQKFYGLTGIATMGLGELIAKYAQAQTLSPVASSASLQGILQSVGLGTAEAAAQISAAANLEQSVQHSAELAGATAQTATQTTAQAAAQTAYQSAVAQTTKAAAADAFVKAGMAKTATGLVIKTGMPLAAKIAIWATCVLLAIGGGYFAYQHFFADAPPPQHIANGAPQDDEQMAATQPPAVPDDTPEQAFEPELIPEPTSEPDEQDEPETVADNPHAEAYMAYYDALKEITDAYGIGRTDIQTDYGFLSFEGVIYSKLIDFDNDGLPELLIVWNDGMPFGERLSVYGHSESLTLLYSAETDGEGGNPNGFDVATSSDGRSFIVSRWFYDADDMEIGSEYYTVQDGGWVSALSTFEAAYYDDNIWDFVPYRWTVNGESVAEDVFSAAPETELGIVSVRDPGYNVWSDEQGMTSPLSGTVSAVLAELELRMTLRSE